MPPLHIVRQRLLPRLLKPLAEQTCEQREQHLADGFIVEVVAALETLGMGVIFGEEGVGIGGIDKRVVNAEKAVTQILVLGRDTVKLMPLHLVELAHGGLRHLKFLFMSDATIEPLVRAGMESLAARGHMEGRIDADAQMAVHLLGVHAAHAGADDDIGLLSSHESMQHGQGLLGVYRDVGRNDLSRG